MSPHLINNRLLESALTHSLNGLAMADLDGRLIYVNPAFVRLWGYSRESDILGRSAVEFWARPEEVQAVIQDMLTQGHWSGELDAIRPDGSSFIASLSGVLILDEQQQPSHFLASFIDVTRRKRAERKLQESEQRLKEAQRIAHLGSWELDLSTGELIWSDEIYRIFNIERVQFDASYEAFLAAVHPDDRALVHKAYADSVANRTPYEITHRLLLKDGDVTYVHERCKTFYDKAGKPIRSVGTVQDVTRQVLAEQKLLSLNSELEQRIQARTAELEKERNFFSTVLDTAGALVVIMNPQGHIIRANRSCEDATGFNFADFRHKPVWEWLIPEADRPGVISTFRDLKKQALPNVHENHVLTADGRQRLITWSNSVITNRHGDVDYIVATGIDITERHQAEQQLLKAKEIAEKANMAKSEFLSRMSHELRTPMNAILGFAQVLEREKLSDSQQDFVDEIQLAGNHLLALINDLLDLSRIESGRLNIALQAVNLRQTVEDAMLFLDPCACEHNIQLSNRCLESSRVVADATRLKQVLVNLISNAIKYNHRNGKVVIDCARMNDQTLRIRVSDTGPGINPGDIPRLFRPFERLDAEQYGIEGTGIGLALSRTLVNSMGGDIGVESIRHQGSTFWVDLPIARDDIEYSDPAHSTMPVSRQHPAVILYIEDNSANLRVIEAMFKQHTGFKLLSAGDGRQGLDLARHTRPDMILLDIHLPDMDGYAVLSRLQADDLTRNIPVVALSADAMQFDIDRGLEAGFSHYLTKPIMYHELITTLDAVLPTQND